jgi:hypothetical protein
LGYFCRMDQLLIVGGGLAGSLLALECHERSIPFKWVISDQIPAASFAAYGMCNPVHLRNQVPVWKASELFEVSRSFFSQWNDRLAANAFKPMPLNHLVTDDQELIRWRQNTESTELWRYTNGEPLHHFHHKLNDELIAEIRIHDSFFLDIPMFVHQVKKMFNDRINHHGMDWNALITHGQLKFEGTAYSSIILPGRWSGCNGKSIFSICSI